MRHCMFSSYYIVGEPSARHLLSATRTWSIAVAQRRETSAASQRNLHPSKRCLQMSGRGGTARTRPHQVETPQVQELLLGADHSQVERNVVSRVADSTSPTVSSQAMAKIVPPQGAKRQCVRLRISARNGTKSPDQCTQWYCTKSTSLLLTNSTPSRSLAFRTPRQAQGERPMDWSVCYALGCDAALGERVASAKARGIRPR